MKSISIGAIPLPNPVLLAPMSGVTDAPFRRLAASLGAGLVVSEMTACAALAGSGRAVQQRMARRRIEDHGGGLHVVQIAGCEACWMGEGARIAEEFGRRHHRHQHGLPGQARHRRPVGLGADARPRSCADADQGGGRGGARASDVENAAWLGRCLAQRAGTRAARARRRRAARHRTWPHPLPVL